MGKSQAERIRLIDTCSADRVSYRLDRKGKTLTLITSLPVTIDGRNSVLEFTDDETGRFSLSDDPQTQKALITDELTGLYNRRFINKSLSKALYSPKESFTLMMVDIDRFKAVNDTFGHVAGDRVLCQFAGLLLSRIRKGLDWVARYGGEEFLIYLKESDRKPVLKAAERIRQAVMNHGFRCSETAIRLTCSIGVCRISGTGECPSVEESIEQVDGKLYEAKRAGRNRIMMV